jgi:hypothetical protein
MPIKVLMVRLVVVCGINFVFITNAVAGVVFATIGGGILGLIPGAFLTTVKQKRIDEHQKT